MIFPIKEVHEGIEYTFMTKTERDDFYNKLITQAYDEAFNDESVEDFINNLTKQQKKIILDLTFDELSEQLERNSNDDNECIDDINFLLDFWGNKKDRLYYIASLLIYDKIKINGI